VDEARLRAALAPYLTPGLADELVTDFIKLRRDSATLTLERASPGKFVEALVQCLQQLATGKFDAKPDVDAYLSKQVENQLELPEGLRVCAARLARFIYTLRNKRNIAHKNPIDPNRFDLALAHEGAAWIMAELLRNATGVLMEEAGVLIQLIQTPVGTLVEEIDGVRLIHADASVRGEVLILLHSHYPERVPTADILKTMKARSAGSVRNRLGELRLEKRIVGDVKAGYRLTQSGYSEAVETIRAILQSSAERTASA
jgi:hypothetical protein